MKKLNFITIIAVTVMFMFILIIVCGVSMSFADKYVTRQIITILQMT